MPLSPQQIEKRKTMIGASDVGAVLGLNPYRGAFDVWARFHLPETPSVDLHEDDPDRLEYRSWGNILEEPIAQEYARRNRVEIRMLRDDETWVHPKLSWFGGHPDRLLVLPKKKKGLEVKTANWRVAHRWGSPDEELFPDEYRAQCVSYMAIGECDEWDLAALIGGSDFRVYRMHRDAKLEASIIEGLEEFHAEFIVGGNRPAITTSPQAGAWLKKLFPRDTAPLIPATKELVDLARHFDDVHEKAKAAESEKEFVGNQLREAIGDAEGFAWGKKSKVTWKANKDGVKVDLEAVVKELGVPDEILQKHTRITPGARVLRVAIKDT